LIEGQDSLGDRQKHGVIALLEIEHDLVEAVVVDGDQHRRLALDLERAVEDGDLCRDFHARSLHGPADPTPGDANQRKRRTVSGPPLRNSSLLESTTGWTSSSRPVWCSSLASPPARPVSGRQSTSRPASRSHSSSWRRAAPGAP